MNAARSGAPLGALRSVAARALRGDAALLRVPPLGAAPHAYGDLVPLGFVLLGLRTAAAALDCTEIAAECDRVRDHLLANRSRGLWAYQSGGLETSIDSALILLALDDPVAVAELQRFHTGGGAYVPQLATRDREAGKMTVRDSLQHWCREDYTIACLVRALRARHRLPEMTSLAVLEAGFDARSGLFLANPYWADWALALALERDPAGAPLRERLRREILASRSPDGSFGRYDAALSSALAILALRALGTDEAELERSLAALADLLRRDVALPALPFYSTEQVAWSTWPPWDLLHVYSLGGAPQLIRVGGTEHAITFYRDTEGLIVNSLAVAALFGAARAPMPSGSTSRAPGHRRYACASAGEYVAEVALPPYLTDQAAAR